MKGTFVSLLDNGIVISTLAELNEKTGEITTEPTEVNEIDILESEYFVNENGEEFEVCNTCHNYILKTVMKEGIGKTLFEAHVCSNPDCENQ